MARPTKGKDKMSERITFYLSKDLFNALKEARFDLRLERSDLIRDAIIEYLEKHLPKDSKSKTHYKKIFSDKK